ncbi:MAG: RusA family crossover junction endodeoxyribonuclease [Clostridium sp.]|jgi:Holliday junction resolvase RusA-like endonuclease|uniref:RusA family crossover junction endodeoxyribonuclease n=1 Tax=Clostridium sp. TaxID=1506 RepID=UPI0025C04DC7|nr:RusA family crossover junction endodeoxyribonuclease [Clostridium sp.]MCI9069953.1 RusA family crossover junction endodeoxyribonuclease [Clostridium sp.]MCI9304039.1 RusA family crossover junction endodeoxyribonuclease [Clostridium sp.]
MSDIMFFTCPIPPSVNDYLGKKVAYNPVTKKPYVQVYETAKAKAFKSHMKKVLKRTAEECAWEKTGEFTYVVCEVKMYSNKKRKDADNIFKCLLDTLTENNIVYDDSMILPRVIDLLIDKDNPRLEVTLKKSSKVGIFESEQVLNIFLGSNCNRCSRLTRNCSILKRAKENKVGKEIEQLNLIMYSCHAFKEKKEKA